MRRYRGQDVNQRQKDPLYGDVKYGTGGIAGGKFVMNDGQTNPVTQQYANPDYISGAGGYILGEI